MKNTRLLKKILLLACVLVMLVNSLSAFAETVGDTGAAEPPAAAEAAAAEDAFAEEPAPAEDTRQEEAEPAPQAEEINASLPESEQFTAQAAPAAADAAPQAQAEDDAIDLQPAESNSAVFGIAVTQSSKLLPFRFSESGRYASILVEGTYKKNQDPSVVKASPQGTGTLTVLEAWQVLNVKNNADLTLTATLDALPDTLGEAETLSFYALMDGRLDSTALQADIDAGDQTALDLAHKGADGIALVKQAADADDLPTDGTVIWANDDVYLTGKMPKNAIVVAEPVPVEVNGEFVLAAYDIRIYNNANKLAKGQTWQPAGDKVQVHFRDKAFKAGDQVNIYHRAAESGAFEKVDTVTAEDAMVTFEAGSFSVYAATVLEKTVEAKNGDIYRITATYDKQSGIPADAELRAAEIEVDNASYERYLRQTADALHVDVRSVAYSRLFDISIVGKDGTVYQPNDAVSVTIELLNADARSVESMRVVHFGSDESEQKGQSVENADAAAKELTAQTNGRAVTFSTDGFSVFSLIDTSVISRVVNAIFGTGNDKLYENDDIILTGNMPLLGTVEASPVTVEIDGQPSLLGYDIKIYANSLMKLLGIAWQPSEGALQVTMKSDNLTVNAVDVYHMETASSAAELVTENIAVSENSVTFDAGKFSVYVIVETKLTETVDASDGNTYEIEVTYKNTSGIPMEGTALLVSELKQGDARYDEYVAASAAKVGTKAENIELSRVFNIQIVDENDHSTVYEPVGDVEVSIRLVGETLNNYANLDVLHFVEDENTEGFTVYDMDSIVDGETVQFTTDSFSVYVVTGYVLETTIDIEGQTYKVTATYDDNAGIPGDAKLKVSEMDVEDEDYLTYLNNTAEALHVSVGELGYLRMFDISIVGNDGTEYKPNDQVTVTVELMDETETGNLRVVHFGDKTQELNATTEGDIVTFTTDSFSLFSFVDLTLIQNVVDAVFGSTYTDQIYENDDIIVSGRMPRTAIVEVNPAEVEIEGQDVLVAYDIKIYAGLITKALGIAWQPTDGALTVQMKSDALDVEAADVYHMADASSTAELVAEAVLVKENTIIFEADAFSVYVVIDHEGNTTVTTPRVQFHFISQDYTGTANPYSASPFNFYNKADPAELQCSQILTKNESLEMIANPPNIIVYTHTTDTAIDAAKTYYTYASGTYSAVDNPDVGDIGTYYEATGEKFFYGWYVVNKVEDSTTYNGSAWTGTIRYNWPANPDKISFEKPMSLTDADGNALTGATVLTAGSTELKWTIDGVTYSGTLDNEGIIHVYLAPIYEDYYFINFRMGALDDSGNALQHSLMTRRLVVFGSSHSTSVRIGDIICPSYDPTHLVFIGWQTQAMHEANDQYYSTVDATGNEQNSSGSTSGYYITLSNTDFSGTVYDLYPLFAEARWLNFNTGKSGIGATYVGSTYRLTNDQTRGTYYENSFFNANTSTRYGYSMAGWYAFANMNDDSEITNLGSAQNVEVSYMDENSVVQTVTFNMKALELVHGTKNGDTYTYSLVAPTDGTIATATKDGHSYTLSASGGIVYLHIDGTAHKLFGVESNQLYFYRTMDDLTVSANWIKNSTAEIRVIIWKQKVTDDKTTTKTPVDLLTWLNEDDSREASDYPYAVKGYDYEIFYLANQSTASEPDLTQFTGTYRDTTNNTQTYSGDLTNLGYTGFHYSADDVDLVGAPNSDGTSVYNVYYDRNVHRLTFQVSGAGYNYTVTTANTGTQYAFINGQFVQLTNTNGVWYGPKYDYTYSENDSTGTYGKVGDKYYELTKHVGSYTYNRTGYTYTYNDSTTNNGTRYGIVNGSIVGLTRNSYWGSVYYSYNNNRYSGYRYTRSNSSTAAYTGDLYTLINGTAGNNQSGFTTTTSVTGDNLFGRNGNNNTYFQLRVNESDVSYTYVDDNGVTQNYTGEHRYDKVYAQTGTEEYSGTRYTRSNANNWHTVYIIEALYKQTISNYFPIPGYDNGERWDPQANNQNWNEVMVVVEAMPDEDVTFRLNTSSTPIKTMNYYVEVLPGETGTVTYNGKQFKLHGEPVLARYNGVTSEDFIEITGFTKIGWTDANGQSNPYNDTFYIYSQSQAQTINFFYSRDQYNFTFDVNYPVDAALTYSNGESTNLVIDEIYYEASLAEYATRYGVDSDSVQYEKDLTGPDHYIFGGWYEDKSCTVPFNFNSTMPVGNKIVYAKWEKDWFVMHIDPNGAEIDHVDHAGGGFTRPAIPGERQADSGYDPSQSTYFWLSYGSLISEYDVSRNYVPISDAAASQYTGTIYYYMNHQYAYDQDGEWGFDAKVRNALYLTESELHDYYLYYKSFTGSAALDEDIWQQYYTSYGKQKYRVTNNQEHYVFLGWYQVFDAGEATEHLGDMPYVFSTPISGDVYLRAMWRLDGGYKIQYHADYTMDDGTWINGDMEAWIDPKVGDITLSYADGAHTNVYKQPTNIRTPQGPTDEYIFRGFRLVSVREDSHGNMIYKPMETDDQGNVSRYYDPGDVFTIRAANADTNSIIHLQAVYEEIDSSYRRPYITNLTLDANGGYLVNADGSTMMHNTDLTTSSGWDEIGTVAATVEDPTTGASLNPDAIIEFGDIQSNVALHLYRYATKLTHAGGNPSGTVLDPAGTNYFAHPRNYFLLGFDEGKTEGDYIATYGADAIISIDRNQAQTIYAVWEPMIYLNFKNETESTIHFGLSSTNALTMYILNEVTGLYDREKISDPSNISLKPNATIHLALPYGEEQSITVSGTNELGVGKILTWDTSVTDDSSGITYCTRTQGTGGIYTHADVTYTHQRVVDWNTNQTENCDHVLAHGQRDSSGDGAFSFDETLLINSKGLTVIFDEDNIDYALVLNDNYNGDGTGGGTQEYDYTNDYLNYTPHHSQLLPSTSSRMGYQLLGWAYRADATTPDFSTTSPAGNPWTIADLYDFFNTNTLVQKESINGDKTMKATLYAVWGVNNEASTVYIYKNVPEPGNQNIPFDFTLNLSGTYIPSGSGSGQSLSASGAFQLYHGDYAILRSYNSTEQGLLRTEITVHKANGEDRVTNYKHTADTAIDTFKTYFTRDADTGMYSKVSSPDAANLSSYYEVVNAVVINAASAGSGGSWNPMLITVTETGVTYYDTTITCQAQNTTSKLFIGGHAGGESAAIVGTEVAGYIAHWDSTYAGGTLVFTNQRQTYDITVKKSLTSNTTVPGTFSFVASYEVDGETTTIYDQVTSGTAGTVLTSIPAGAVLTITEANDGSYITKYKIDDGTLVDANAVMETQGGETVRTGSATGSITVDAAKTITLDNTLKSYPVKFRLFDQYRNPLGGMFSLSSSIGSLGNALSASTTNGGVFYPTNYPTVPSAILYVDTYTLTQNIIPTGYVGLSVPATITVTGDGITTNSDMIYISRDPDVTDGYIITVYNIVPSVDITLTKILEDPLLNQRTFNFTVEYVYVLKDEDDKEMLTIHPTQTYNIAATSAGISEVIRVPGGAAVTITENLTSELSAIYDTTYKIKPVGDDFGTPVVATTWTKTIGNAPFEIAFTNTRKTKIVTVIKTLEDSHATGAVDFHFDALLRYNGVGVGGYTLNSATSIVTDDGTGGTTAGHMTFTLSPTASVPASVELTVPYGTMLTVTEDTAHTVSGTAKTVAELYNTSYALNGGTAEDGNSYAFTSVTDDQILAFTNARNSADLTVTKTITGGMGDTTKAFTFTVTNLPNGENYTYRKFTTTDGTTWTEITGGTLSSSTNTFTLTHRQKVIIECLPLNTALTIAEANDNYTTTWQLDSNAATTGSSTIVTLTDDAVLAVTNNLPAVSPTGLDLAYAPFILMAAAGMMLGLIVTFGRRKRREEE